MSAVDSSQLGDSQSTASLFSFANSLNAMTETAAKAERALTGLSPAYGASASSDNGDSGHGGQLLCEVSPMNVTGIYKATILFTAEMDKVVSEAEGESDGDAGSTRARRPRSTLRLTLGSFLDAFLSRAYLPIIKAEVHARLTSIAEAADKPLDDHGLADAPRVLFRSTVEVDEMVGQLCGLMFDLPSKCADFTEMLLHLISRYAPVMFVELCVSCNADVVWSCLGICCSRNSVSKHWFGSSHHQRVKRVARRSQPSGKGRLRCKSTSSSCQVGHS